MKSNKGSALVTGGTGFLGRRIVERLLAQGREVVVLARNPAPDLEARGVRLICASLDDATAVKAACAGVQTVFHVAAKVGIWGSFADYHRTNVLGTRSLLESSVLQNVRAFVHTSTPSVVYNGKDLSGADESLPLTTACPCAYPLTKAQAEKEVLAANGPQLQTIALRPHLIWGPDDPHLLPRILKRAAEGRLRIVGSGKNRVDMVHVENAADAHLLAEEALLSGGSAAGRAFFITNAQPVILWDWINEVLAGLGRPTVRKRIPAAAAALVGAACEAAWSLFRFSAEPPMTRFVVGELSKDHWFNPAAARRDLGYEPKLSMAEGTRQLIESLGIGRRGSVEKFRRVLSKVPRVKPEPGDEL